MRIGIDARALSYEYTGIPIYLYDTIRHWNEHHTEHEYFLYSNRPLNLDIELKNNWHITIDENKRGGLWVQFRLHGLITRDRLDVFWEPMNFLPRKVKGIKYIVTIHDLAVYMYPEYGKVSEAVQQRLFLRLSCKRADRVIADSVSTKNDIIKCLGTEDKKIKVIYIGDSPYKGKEEPDYSDDEKSRILKKWELNGNDYLLFVGTIEPRKNLVTIIEAFDELKDSSRYSGKLVIAGKKGWRYKKILKRIKESPYQRDIVLTGYVNEREKECLYRNAKVLLFTSHYEGFGFPIIEAMSVGLPVVTSAVSSMPEAGGDVAVYLKKSDLTNYCALAGTIEKILKLDEAELRSFSSRGKKQAAKFDRKTAAEQLLKEICNI